MITLKTGDRLISDETLYVFEGGDFELDDLVLVADVGDNTPKYQYSANFIKTGVNYD